MGKKRSLKNQKVEEALFPADMASHKKVKISLGILIGVFAFLLYAQSITFSYTLDDDSVTYLNKFTTLGFKGIPMLLKTDFWAGFFDQLRVPEYRPVSLIIHAMVWQFFPNNPHVDHLLNVLFYALSCFMLFLLLCSLFEKQNLIFPFVCTLLFVAHPIHTEVVDSIKSSDEILCFLFAILSTFLILKGLATKSSYPFILAFICYFFSLCSKETGITFLVIIPLILYSFSKADTKTILKITFSLLSITIIFFIIRYKVLENVKFVEFKSILNNSLVAAPDTIGQKATAIFVLLKYILLLLFPLTLCYDYSFAQIPIQQVGDLGAFIGLLVYLGIGIYAVLQIKNRDAAAFAILLFLITIAPVSNIFILIGAAMAERFLYIPSLGFCMLLTLLLIKITKIKMTQSKPETIKHFVLKNKKLFIIVFIIVGFYSVKTYSRSRNWKDNVALFSHDVAIADKSAKAHLDWGVSLLTEFYPKEKNADKKSQYNDSAINELKKTIAINKEYDFAYYFIAKAYKNKRDYKNSLESYEKMTPYFINLHKDIYGELAFLYGKLGNEEKAIRNYDLAIKYNNNNVADCHNNLGTIYAKQGKYDDALKEFEKAIASDPNFADPYSNLGGVLNMQGKLEEAILNYKKAIELKPENLDP